MSKELWIRTDILDSEKERKKAILIGLEAGISNMIVRPGDDFSSLGKMDFIVNDNGALSGAMKGSIVSLSSPEDQKKVMDMAGKTDVIILTSSDWTIIPLENMIARFRNTGTKIFACASNAEQAKLYLSTLETGVDGIVIEDVSGIKGIQDLFRSSENVTLDTLTVTDIKNISICDRVCIDSCTMMVPGEGMLIGSQSSCLFLIQSESETVGYVNSRPFRVNAGAVHAYILTPDGRTRYLAEIRSGDPVMVSNRDGELKEVSVGRCKIEQRPMILVEAEIDGKKYTTILQNAETVKMVGPERSISVSELKKGDKVLAKLDSGGRHFGMKVDETISEI